MSRVIHTINGIRYWYEHYRVGDKIISKYMGPVDGKGGNRTTGAATRLSNAPKQMSILGAPRYASQDDLDDQIKNSYVRGGMGIKRIQAVFSDELDLHPTRRETENYLKDLGVELRKRSKKPAPPAQSIEDLKAELAQTKDALAIKTIEQDSKDVQIADMRSHSADDARTVLHLKEKLMDYRDMGRPPTDEEIESLIL